MLQIIKGKNCLFIFIINDQRIPIINLFFNKGGNETSVQIHNIFI